VLNAISAQTKMHRERLNVATGGDCRKFSGSEFQAWGPANENLGYETSGTRQRKESLYFAALQTFYIDT